MKTFVTICATLLAAIVITVAVRAGPDNVKFPKNYAKGVLYTTVDRPDVKQYRELFITQFAFDQVKAGKPLPSGTVITMVNYKAKLGADGQPEKVPTAASSRPARSPASPSWRSAWAGARNIPRICAMASGNTAPSRPTAP
jgi:hypothetical protein